MFTDNIYILQENVFLVFVTWENEIIDWCPSPFLVSNGEWNDVHLNWTEVHRELEETVTLNAMLPSLTIKKQISR